MPSTPENVEDASPYNLLKNFSKSRLLMCLLLALLIHAAVIGSLSTGYIYRTWIEPESALPDPQTAATADGTETSSTDGAAPDPAGDAESPGSDQTVGSAEDTGDTPPDAPVVNRVTEQADPAQIPVEPGGLGLSIDDVKE